MTYDRKALAKMTLAELADAGAKLDLKFNKSHSKKERAKRILLRETELAAAATPLDVSHHVTRSSPVSSDSPVSFDRLLEGDEPPKDNRGGKRENAGRKVGSTEDRAAMRHLSEVAHPPVKRGIKAAFELWADVSGCPDVALTDAEAEDLALSPTNALEYTGLIRFLPPWLEILVDGAAVWYLTFKSKRKLACDHQARQRQEEIDRGPLVHHEDPIGSWTTRANDDGPKHE